MTELPEKLPPETPRRERRQSAPPGPEGLHPQLIQALRGVFDPETGRDLIAMGMIYEARLTAGHAGVIMTTTTQGCPLSEMLRMGVEAALLALPGISTAEVRLTWDPAWTPERMEPLAF